MLSIRSASLGLCNSMLNGQRTCPNTFSTPSTTAWCSAGTSDLPVIGATLGMIGLLLEAFVGVAPAVLVHDLRQRPAAHRPEFPHGVADGKNRVGVDAGRYTKSDLGLLFVQEVPGCQRSPEPKGPGCQQHVLHGGVDGSPGPARRDGRPFLEARDD